MHCSLIESSTFQNYLEKMETCVGFSIENLDDLLKAIQSRIDYFDQHGCRLSDYGLEQIYADDFTLEEADTILKKRLSGDNITKEEAEFIRFMHFISFV